VCLLCTQTLDLERVVVPLVQRLLDTAQLLLMVCRKPLIIPPLLLRQLHRLRLDRNHVRFVPRPQLLQPSASTLRCVALFLSI
jgi:hypothetical protein